MELDVNKPWTYDEIKKIVAVAMQEGIVKAFRAPAKRGWSQVLNQQIPSKNDIKRETNQNIQMVAAMAAERFPGKPSLIQEEEDVSFIKVAE
jgi:hypothetical protein|tara:strand:- start:146 stop:421 length:276 start_codon:yes stop_codon:yes gene_type:complete